MNKFLGNIFALVLVAVSFTFCTQNNTSIKNVNAHEFQNMINEQNTILLDVRSSEEYTEGHIDGALNINVNGEDFQQEIVKLDKSKTILVYCQAGRRSASAANILASKGYKVVNLIGGISEWSENNLPIKQ